MEEINFKKKDIERAYRDINACMEDLLSNTGEIMFHTNIKRFIKLTESNNILKYLLEPFERLNTDDVEQSEDGDFWMDLKIPTLIDYQIAYVLKKYKEISEMDSSGYIHKFLFSIYKNNLAESNACEWNQSIVKPAFREIIFRFDDLKEEFLGEEEISTKYMSIINVGNINNSNGNVGIGENINQSNNSSDIFKELIKLIDENIEDDEKEEVINIVDEMKNAKGKPSFKDKVTKFITSTAKYGPIFIGMWDQLQRMF